MTETREVQRAGVYEPALSGVGDGAEDIELVHIEPGRPVQNAFVESFHAKCLPATHSLTNPGP